MVATSPRDCPGGDNEGRPPGDEDKRQADFKKFVVLGRMRSSKLEIQLGGFKCCDATNKDLRKECLRRADDSDGRFRESFLQKVTSKLRT